MAKFYVATCHYTGPGNLTSAQSTETFYREQNRHNHSSQNQFGVDARAAMVNLVNSIPVPEHIAVLNDVPVPRVRQNRPRPANGTEI